jgi:hypothetical protein
MASFSRSTTLRHFANGGRVDLECSVLAIGRTSEAWSISAELLQRRRPFRPGPELSADLRCALGRLPRARHLRVVARGRPRSSQRARRSSPRLSEARQSSRALRQISVSRDVVQKHRRRCRGKLSACGATWSHPNSGKRLETIANLEQAVVQGEKHDSLVARFNGLTEGTDREWLIDSLLCRMNSELTTDLCPLSNSVNPL